MTQTKNGLGDPFERPTQTIIGKKKKEVEGHNTTIPQSEGHKATIPQSNNSAVGGSTMIRTNIYIPRSLKKWLKKYATDKDDDMSGVIIKLLEELKAKEEQ